VERRRQPDHRGVLHPGLSGDRGGDLLRRHQRLHDADRAQLRADGGNKNQTEAEFRAALTRVREYGESIAILGGEKEERAGLDGLLTR
jgi:hypothetical protein